MLGHQESDGVVATVGPGSAGCALLPQANHSARDACESQALVPPPVARRSHAPEVESFPPVCCSTSRNPKTHESSCPDPNPKLRRVRPLSLQAERLFRRPIVQCAPEPCDQDGG